MNCITNSTSIPFSTTNNVSISVNSSNFTSVLLTAACHDANPGAEINFTVSYLISFKHIFQKLFKNIS